jgi:hypothetical protein
LGQPIAFTGDGSTKVFTLPYAAPGGILLYWNGMLQTAPSDYSLSGATITMVDTPFAGDKLIAVPLSQTATVLTGVAGAQTANFTGDGSTTRFTLPSVPNQAAMVYVNGLLQVLTSDYAIAGAVITFVAAPASGARITVLYL